MVEYSDRLDADERKCIEELHILMQSALHLSQEIRRAIASENYDRVLQFLLERDALLCDGGPVQEKTSVVFRLKDRNQYLRQRFSGIVQAIDSEGRAIVGSLAKAKSEAAEKIISIQNCGQLQAYTR